MSLTVLEREVFTVGEAARQLGVPPSTLRWWLEGKRAGKYEYPPVIRVDATGSPNVTWGEFVEAGYLRAYRQEHEVPLPHLRKVIDFLRDEIGVPYPLATFQPFVGEGRRLVLEAQRIADLPSDFWLVVGTDSQVLLTAASESFLERVEFAPAGELWAERIRPAGNDSPVVMDPDYSSAAPTVQGVRTEALVELVDAGEPIEEVADSFGLSVEILKAALAFEWSRVA